MNNTITASAPGSLMITGEHAVLHGARALVGAVDARVDVQLTPRKDRRVGICSTLGRRLMDLDAPDVSPPFQFLARAIAAAASACPSGFDFNITATMPPDAGLGSSAAVTVAALTALHAFCHGGVMPDLDGLYRRAVAIVRAEQGIASGADIAAAVRGGVLFYTSSSAVLSRHTIFPDIVLIYAGYKTPTPEVIRRVEARRAVAPDGFRSLYSRMDACSEAADAAFAAIDWLRLATALQRGQALMEELGVCDAALADIVRRLHTVPGLGAAKISGSGLGDCVLALSSSREHLAIPSNFPYARIPVQFSTRGAKLHAT